MLEPYTVLDFTDERGEIGPMLLGDLGANVIRVELPAGSPARQTAPLLPGAPGDLASLQFHAFNRNKRSITLDPNSDADRKTLHKLIERADFLFESWPAETLNAFGINFAQARTLSPRLIHVRISAFGSDGPHADFVGSDLVLAAMGGPVSLQGPNDRAPVRISVPQAWRHAGAEAAVAALAAHARMLRCGEAQFVDLSAQCAMTWTMLNAMDAAGIQGFDFERGGSGVGGSGIEIVHPTADGFIVALPMSNVLQGLTEWMIADGAADASLHDIEWDAYDMNARLPGSCPLSIEEGTSLLRRFFAGHTKNELYEYGLTHGITLAPVRSEDDPADEPHQREADGYVAPANPQLLGREVTANGRIRQQPRPVGEAINITANRPAQCASAGRTQ